MSNKVQKLRDHGFRVEWVRSDIKDDNWYGYIGPYDTSKYCNKGDLQYVNLGTIAKGTDGANQTSTYLRSNYRKLREDFPDIWTDTSYSNVDVLGAFVADLPDEVIDILIHLKGDDYVYDSDDLSALENDEITESWDEYVRSDITIVLYKADVENEWDALTHDAQKAMFWAAVTKSDYYPEHDGLDIIWHFDKILPVLVDMLRK